MSGDPRPVGEDDLHGLIDGRLEPERRALVEAWL
ncbi:anti-sigma factor, partial [Methylobacterium sp. WL122]